MLRPLFSLLVASATVALVACGTTSSDDASSSQSAELSSTPIMQACRGERSCFSVLNGVERGLCESYKEGRSCFSSLNGEDRGWCEVIVEGRSCFVSLDGAARDKCERAEYPDKHRFWADCGDHDLPAGTVSTPLQQACRGERSCFSALTGVERGLCEAYKEGRSCFASLNGEDRGWCEVIVEGRSCFASLNGEARERCEAGEYPAKHRFWKQCGGH